MPVIRFIHERLKKLRVQHADDEVKAAVVVGDDGKQGSFFRTHAGQVQLVAVRLFSQVSTVFGHSPAIFPAAQRTVTR